MDASQEKRKSSSVFGIYDEKLDKLIQIEQVAKHHKIKKNKVK